MKIVIAIFVAALFAFVSCEGEEEKVLKDVAQLQHVMLSRVKPQMVVVELGKEKPSSVKVVEMKVGEAPKTEEAPKTPSHEPSFKVDQHSLQSLLSGRSETLFASKMIEFYLKNPEYQFQRKCYAENLKYGDSIDFVIDLAPSPSMDPVDKRLADSPMAYYLQEFARTPSRAYFGLVEIFIETVTRDMKPSMTHTVIYDNGDKYYIRGRHTDEKIAKPEEDFKNDRRNLLTMWPSPTKTTSESCFREFIANNLGHVTKLVLWNRASGLPSVLAGSRHSKPVYTIVITDGASGAKIHDLTDDLSRTTLIDLGNRRFVKNMSLDEMKQLANVYTFSSPQLLPMAVDTCRVLACNFASHQ